MTEPINILMTALAGLPDVEIEAHGLVRKADGTPRIDGDPRKLHHSVIAALTPEEFEVAKQEWDRKNGKTE